MAYVLSDSLGKASDATAFLSTTAVVMGVLVTIIGAALVQALTSSDRVDPPRTAARRIQLIALTLIVLADFWGVSFPLYALYLDTLHPISDQLVRDVFISTILVGAGNVLIPLLIINLLHNARLYRDMFSLALLLMSADLDNNVWIERLRLFLTANSAMPAETFDKTIDDIRSEKLTEPQVTKLASEALSKLASSNPWIYGGLKIPFIRDRHATIIGRWLVRSLQNMEPQQTVTEPEPRESRAG